jgi:hypothetical protein
MTSIVKSVYSFPLHSDIENIKCEHTYTFDGTYEHLIYQLFVKGPYQTEQDLDLILTFQNVLRKRTIPSICLHDLRTIILHFPERRLVRYDNTFPYIQSDRSLYVSMETLKFMYDNEPSVSRNFFTTTYRRGSYIHQRHIHTKNISIATGCTVAFVGLCTIAMKFMKKP